MKQLKCLNSVFSLLNIITGFFAIILVFQGDRYSLLAAFILTLILDSLGGIRLKRGSDSICRQARWFGQMISFIVVPALISYIYLFKNSWEGLLIAAIILGCGMKKLVDKSHSEHMDYEIGMPVPYFAVLVMSFMIFVNVPGILVFVFLLIISFLMISDIKFPNFSDKSYHHNKVWAILWILIFLISLILYAFTSLNLFYLIMIEHITFWLMVLVPLGWRFKNMEIFMFLIGLVLSTAITAEDPVHLMLVPITYFVLASPMIQKAIDKQNDYY